MYFVMELWYLTYVIGLNIYSQHTKWCLGCIPKNNHYLYLDKIQHTDTY